MKNDDYGFYGKGIDGYVHYMQAFNETQKEGPRGRRIDPPSTKNEGDSHERIVMWVLVLFAGFIMLGYLLG